MNAAAPPRVARLLALPGGADDSAAAAPLARGFQLFLLLHVTVRTLLWAWKGEPDEMATRLVLPAGLAVCLVVAALRPAWARAATFGALLLLTVKFAGSFPTTSNHFFIEYCCVALLAFCDLRDAGERALALDAARWLLLIVLFWSGAQKVLAGTYFHGTFLAFSIATRPTFTNLFAWLMPADEIARLQATVPIRPGAGPFELRTPLALAVANATWMFEIVAPVLLVWRRTRVWAVLATVVFLLCVELAARELMFGALFANLLLLFLPWPLNRTLLPAFAAFYAVLIAVRLGYLPGFHFN